MIIKIREKRIGKKKKISGKMNYFSKLNKKERKKNKKNNREKKKIMSMN